ncbi:bifunctional non-homologous end joining protein LigD [Modicisalibacter ilicicola DSM 19980]|uniref:DNA ligase (ATP) n=2 Tax=Modicisalibacter ilicicola TaxID=480814 RepID=A0A1M5BT78_9GAMM|nr:bifunctional non-homologous end joining protein LigD [Halomonas ilicicola DSM 19980]
MGRLEEYRRKRDFKRTSEPAGDETKGTSGRRRFVIHKHAASHDHFDLRLEQDGVLRSWALPKGPSLESGEKRLAIEVEDHPLSYADFEGVIPKEAYGGGTVMLWDRGHWEPTGKHGKGRIDFELHGEKLKGAWTLTRLQGRGNKKGSDKDDRQWLLIKRSDDEGATGPRQGVDDDRSVASGRSMRQIAEQGERKAEAPGAEPSGALPDPERLEGGRRHALPKEVRPQLATLSSEVPEGDDWIHEIKFDGYRVLARVEDGDVRLTTRNAKDWTHRFPELAECLARLPVKRALLDGEVVSLGRDGTSSFRRLQEALSRGRTDRLVYQVFDLLHLENRDLRQVALVERKQALAQLLEAAGLDDADKLRYSDHVDSRGEAFFDKACRLGLEGIVSKRASSHYQATRSKQWRKVKCANHEEFVIGGYTDPGGSRQGFGALLMGAFDDEGRLAYAGRVGTGFTTRQLDELAGILEKLDVEESPFNGPVPDTRSVHWVRPERVIEVEFTERTRDGRLRHPAFRGLREDRDPEEIRVSRSQDKRDRNAVGKRSDPSAGSGSDPSKAEGDQLLGVRLTHADRVLYPDQGLTKGDLARFYLDIQEWILPHLVDRPLSLVRCPEGRTGECFFQKHPNAAIDKRVPRISLAEKQGEAEYLYVQSAADLVALVQAGTLEIHPWGSRVDDLERPDNLVFDLDPAPNVAWQKVLHAAATLRDRLASLELASFVRTTGGKGLHLVVPLTPEAQWEEAKAFAEAVARQHAQDDPGRLTANMAKTQRRGRVFIDYLRNARGATAVASYSVRAKKGAPVCVPLRWDELNAALHSDRYTTENLRRRLAALKEDPWSGFEEARRPITAKMRKAVGLE